MFGCTSHASPPLAKFLVLDEDGNQLVMVHRLGLRLNNGQVEGVLETISDEGFKEFAEKRDIRDVFKVYPFTPTFRFFHVSPESIYAMANGKTYIFQILAKRFFPHI